VDNLIIGGDLNMIWNRDEMWGTSSREDRLDHYFVDKFELVGWVDIDHIQLQLTWSNNIFGLGGVAKRLD
jgi:hypothetical protein